MFVGSITTDFPNCPSDQTAPEYLVDELASILVRRDRDEARAASVLARIDETRAFERDGYTSPTAMLKHRMSLHPGEAHRLVRRANVLPEMTRTAMAYEQGAISGAQVDVLIEARAIAPEQFEHAEGELVQLAMDTPPVTELKKRLDYWLMEVAAEELAADRDRVREASALNLRRDGEMMRINGWTDLESGERLAARLDPGPPTAGDTRSAAADGPTSSSKWSRVGSRSGPGSSSMSPPRPCSKDCPGSRRLPTAPSSPRTRSEGSPVTPT